MIWATAHDFSALLRLHDFSLLSQLHDLRLAAHERCQWNSGSIRAASFSIFPERMSSFMAVTSTRSS